MVNAGKVLLTAAPGGHSGYALAIGYFLKKLGVQPVFLIARRDEWTRRKLSRHGEIVEVIMPRKPGQSFWVTLHRWPKAFFDSLKVVKKSYKIIVSCGANLSLAPSLIGKLKGLILLNIESIVRLSTPGKTPRLLHYVSDKTIVHWPEQARLYPGDKTIVVGPIYEPPKYTPKDEGFILVTAGTMGHPRLFDALNRLNLHNIVLQTGKVDPTPYMRRHPEWIVFRFDPDLDRWIARASIVITHFPGMTSATAALAYRKPVILVAAHHLKLSAKQEDGPIYANKIGALYLREVTPESLLRAIKKAHYLDPKKYPNGAEKITELIIKYIK
jgi:UDP-N-acetylglucosamine--N-acetylmuramyl-(pentapeptide) pyrophosphoryl-undecaprenol N-acetylglucosamine transferase